MSGADVQMLIDAAVARARAEERAALKGIVQAVARTATGEDGHRAAMAIWEALDARNGAGL